MSCISHLSLCPASGDTDNVLLQKILQSLGSPLVPSGGATDATILATSAATAATLVTTQATTAALLVASNAAIASLLAQSILATPATNPDFQASVFGLISGRSARVFKILGRRAGFTSLTVSNDVKEFDNGVANIPVLAASTLDIISSNVADTNTAGTGVRQVKVTYINSTNDLVESAAISLNGTTLVTSVLTGVNAVLWMESFTAGSGEVAAGNIRLRINGGTVEVEQITAGGNKSLSARFMVPAGHTAYLDNFRVSAVNNDQDCRLRATVNSVDRTLATLYHFQMNGYTALNSTSGPLPGNFLKFPALSRIKVSTISAGTAATVRCDTHFTIVLIAD